MTAPKDNDNTGDSTALFALLESRHETLLQWCESWSACGPEGNDLNAHIILRATVHDCINMQRRVAKEAGRSTMGDDVNHLLDFMAIHWARVVEEKFMNNPYIVTTLRLDCNFNIEEKLIDLNIPWFETNHEYGQRVDLVVGFEDIGKQLCIKQNNNNRLTGFDLELANILSKYETEFDEITFSYQRGV